MAVFWQECFGVSRSIIAMREPGTSAMICALPIQSSQPAWNNRMAKKTVLAIGIEPSFADFTAFPQLTPELVSRFIGAQVERLRALGYDADSCLIDLGQTAEAVT